MDAERRAKISVRMKKFCSDPAERKRRSAAAKARWADPEMRQKWIEAMNGKKPRSRGA